MVHETDLQALRCEERLEFWEAEATDGPVPASVVDWETEIGGWTLEGDAQAARAAIAPPAPPPEAPPAVPSPASAPSSTHSAKRRSPDDAPSAPSPKRTKTVAPAAADEGLRAIGVNANVDPRLLQQANWSEILAGIAALLEFMMRARAKVEDQPPEKTVQAFEDSVAAEPNLATIRSFLRDMAKICRYTPECNVIALILLIRFFAYQPSLKLTDRTWRRYLLTALMISQKYWDDRCLRNIDFTVAWRCALPGQTLELEAVNAMEKFFLTGIGYDLYIQPDKYTACLTEVRSIVGGGGTG
jgi:hypothetical protein